MNFTERKFNILKLVDISENSINEHLKLYAGYVKHSNLIIDKIDSLSSDIEANSYAIGELQRRFGFEFDGMRNHEYYFEQLETRDGATKNINETSKLATKLNETFGSYSNWLNRFKTLAMTRGIGWAFLYYDPTTDRLLHAWVDEQHLGHLTSLKVVLALDMWEHSYMLDYAPSEKKKYVEAFFANLNWDVLEKRFEEYTK
jgi:superoxide dismutase, Fe-Mn family